MTTVAAQTEAEELRYAVLEGTVVVESDGELPDEAATAFEGRLEPPYRVVGVGRATASGRSAHG